MRKVSFDLCFWVGINFESIGVLIEYLVLMVIFKRNLRIFREILFVVKVCLMLIMMKVIMLMRNILWCLNLLVRKLKSGVLMKMFSRFVVLMSFFIVGVSLRL